MTLKELMALMRSGVEEFERSMVSDGFEGDDEVEVRECLGNLGDLLEENLEHIEAKAQGSTIG